MNTPTPDYGEPWSADERPQHDAIFTKDSTPLCLMFYKGGFAQRAAVCVSACEGMTDPAKEIAALRESLLEQAKTNAELRAKLVGWHENETIRAMREVILEADALFDDFSKACNHKDNTANTVQLEWIVSKSRDSRAKLQPFITLTTQP